MENVENWFALYTKPRWEKKVAIKLSDINISVYCPLNRVIRQWSDRKKTVYEPLFRGYVFVKISPEQMTAIKQIDGVVNFVYWNGKPAVVRQHEIELIQRFLSEFSEIEVEDVGLKINERVVVKKGILTNYQGIIL